MSEDGVVASFQGVLLDPARFRDHWEITAEQAEAIARAYAGEPTEAPAEAYPEWVQKGDEAEPIWSVALRSWNDPARGMSSGYAVSVSAETGQVRGFSSTTTHAPDSAWEWEDFATPSVISSVALSAAATQTVPISLGDCGEARAVGDWMSVYSGEDADGVWPIGPDIQGFVLQPVLSDGCRQGVYEGFTGPTYYDLPYFPQASDGEVNCGDGLDDDGNGFLDCLDRGCIGTAVCATPAVWSAQGTEEQNCSDAVDDGTRATSLQPPDGLTDCADPECDESPLCLESADAPGKYEANARVRIGAFLTDYMSRYHFGFLHYAPLDLSKKPLTVVVERPRDRSGNTVPNPIAKDNDGSFTRPDNAWLPKTLQSYEPAYWPPASARWTIVLSRNGDPSVHDRDGGRSAGVQFHEASHYWLRAHGGALGAPSDDYSVRSQMAVSFDEGFGYYSASSFLSRPDPLGPDTPEAINFVATHFPSSSYLLSADEMPHLRYYLTWDKVEPCFAKEPGDCENFAAYVGPQFIIRQGVNDEVALSAVCGPVVVGQPPPSPITMTLTIPPTPETIPGSNSTWWSGRELAGQISSALVASWPACEAQLAAQSPPGELVVKWVADRSAGPQGLLIGCNGCSTFNASFNTETATTLGLPSAGSATGVALEASNTTLYLPPASAWPSGPYNRDCRDFIVANGATYGGVGAENDTSGNCRAEESTYFFGDLLTQTLWDLRAIAPDPELWEALVVGAVSLTRDCSGYEEDPQVASADCPDLFQDYFMNVEWLSYFYFGAAHTEAVADILDARGLR